MKVMNPRLVQFAKRIDFVWRILACIAPSRKRSPHPITSILVVDLHLLGDVVMLVPLLKALRDRYPLVKISLLAGPWAHAILSGTQLVDEIITYVAPWVKTTSLLHAVFGYFRMCSRLRVNRWDVGIDVRGDIRQILMLYISGCKRRVGFNFTGGGSLLTDIVPDDGEIRHILDHHERIANHLDAWNGQPFVPALTLNLTERRTAENILPFIGIHLGASLPLRRLPLDEAVALVSFCSQSEDLVILFSTPEMEDYTEEVIGLLPKVLLHKIEIWRGTLREFIVKASRARRVFAMDSGPAHISAALGCETIVFFGPNLPKNTGPRGHRVHFLEDTSVVCRPCDQHHCINSRHQACMLGSVNVWAQKHRSIIQLVSYQDNL